MKRSPARAMAEVLNDSIVHPYITLEIDCGNTPKKAVLTSNLVMVLRKADELGSLHGATKHFHMGYSHTLYAIAEIEDALGCTILDRVCSKGSTLTDEVCQLLDLFERVQEKTQKYAAGLVQKREGK